MSKQTIHKDGAPLHRITTINKTVKGLQKTFVKCDGCSNEVPQSTAQTIIKKDGKYGYCQDCMKANYPSYQKISFISSYSNMAKSLENDF
jgi:ribosomal protein S26